MSEITFGTDGWRAVIGEGYTFANLERVARATGLWLQATGGARPSAVVGYDTRFLGAEFAARTAQVLATMGVRVQLSDTFVTTPAVSWAAQAGGHTAGIVITASHNPPAYNGFKIKAGYGGPASPEMIAAVEAQLAGLKGALRLRPLSELAREGLVEPIELRKQYVALLKKRLDIEAIKEAQIHVGYDAMYGAGQGIVAELLGKSRVVELHHDHNPGMHGRAPEPIERNLATLGRTVVDQNLAVGLATDGDADRIGLFDEQGRFVDAHKILALLVKYLHVEKRLRGEIVKTFSTTDMLDRMAAAYQLPLTTTPIGFKHIAPRIVEGDVLVGGEESGGLAVKGHLPERDGLYIGLTVVEMVVKRERSLSGLVRELQDEFGPLHQSRQDLHTTEDRKQAFLGRLRAGAVADVGGRAIERTETLDGYKFRLDGAWLMFRASGTEPVLRIYAEARTKEEADALVHDGAALVEG